MSRNHTCTYRRLLVGLGVLLLFNSLALGESIRLATYNLNNYLVMDRYLEGAWRKSYPKPESEKAIIRQVILQTAPDILILQEIGPIPFLKELQGDLAQEGIDYPHLAHVKGSDSIRHLAVLSKIEPLELVRHQDLEIRYQNKNEFVKRGMLELSFERTNGSSFKVFTVHLKSRRTTTKSDPQSLRRRTLEAEACRNRIIERTFDLETYDFIIVGDFNDHPRSAPLRRFYQRGKQVIGKLVPAFDSRGERWTHYYAREAVYSLVDSFIASESLFPQVKDQRGHIIDTPDVLNGSDHRMVYLDLMEL